jgi:hypothetical protein
LRDSLQKANKLQYGNKYYKLIWEVFANRGMGYAAITKNGDDTSPVEDFSLPPDFQSGSQDDYDSDDSLALYLAVGVPAGMLMVVTPILARNKIKALINGIRKRPSSSSAGIELQELNDAGRTAIAPAQVGTIQHRSSWRQNLQSMTDRVRRTAKSLFITKKRKRR